MKILKRYLLYIFFSFPFFFQAHAKMVIPDQRFEAPVSSFSKKWVKVFHRGKIWRVPRSRVANPKAVKIGKRVLVVLREQDFKQVKVEDPKPAEKRKK